MNLDENWENNILHTLNPEMMVSMTNKGRDGADKISKCLGFIEN